MSHISRHSLKWVPILLLALGSIALQGFAQQAQQAPRQSQQAAADRLYAEALASFREARFPEAYGRLMALADAGHAPAAELVLWMYRSGPELFGSLWDCTPDQLAVWSLLVRHAGRPAPMSETRANPVLLPPAMIPAAVHVAAKL